ncbi:hypothetical protein NI389_07485 [Pseudoalteromonas xiamenensis]|nr:hypothetical protein [Pseudoalteromonas xiamenensis]WMN61215.1 hypothetical protein NI389_07485 [Pseudoalteromonas xiamenensis]
MSLTGGLILKNIGKQQRFVEIEKVKNLLKVVSYESFFNGRNTVVSFRDKSILIKGNNRREIEFKELIFLPSEINFNMYGMSSKTSFSIIVNGG